jgi:hypothetical protein
VLVVLSFPLSAESSPPICLHLEATKQLRNRWCLSLSLLKNKTAGVRLGNVVDVDDDDDDHHHHHHHIRHYFLCCHQAK